ncbi:hypothetical protein BJX99DRAFT_255076 [Aspergillus californicus]
MQRLSFSQQSLDPTTLARFQLAKFSYTTTSIDYRGPLTWNHIFGNGDITARFERRTISPSGPVVFKVLRNDETLEDIGITDLLNQYESQLHSMQGNPKRPGFAVVVKPPCLAVKYPARNTCIRRIQIKFSSDREYYSALALLSDINCPFSESQPSPAQPIGRSSSYLPKSEPISLSSATRAPGSDILHPLPSSSSSSITLYDTNRSTSALNFTSRSPFDPTDSTTPASRTKNGPVEGRFQRPNTSTGYTGFHDTQDLDESLPPTRELPFHKPGPKPGLPKLKPVDTAASKSSTSNTPLNGRAKRKRPNPQATPTTSSSPTTRSRLTMRSSTTPHSFASPTSCSTTINPDSKPLIPTPTDFARCMSNPTIEGTNSLENWICTHIEDDGFTQLVENVEGIWMRFAQGLSPWGK